MKTIPLLAATGLAVLLLVSPAVVFGAGSISFTSPAAGASYQGTQSYSIAGTVSPTPSQADNVFISVKNPAGTIVDAGSVAVSLTTGGFTYATATGGSASWYTGTYTITATDSYGATGSITFSYTGLAPTGTYNLQGNITYIEKQLKIMNTTLNALAAQDNTESSNIAALQQSVSAISNNLQTVASNVATLQTNLATLTTNVGTLQTDVTNMQGQLTTISNNITTLNAAVQAAQQAAQNAQKSADNANSAVSSTQTYVLVVAVLAAITLVLELAILVRKLS
jgi:archaellum component FlaC